MSSLDEYVENLKSPDERERAYAAEDIGYLNVPEGLGVLMDHLLQETSVVVRQAISQALIRMDGDQVIQRTIWLFDSDDPQLRNLAVDVLRHKADAAIPFFASVMRNGDSDMRKFVLDVLSGTPSVQAEEIYMSALADRDSNVVITAVENVRKGKLTSLLGIVAGLLANNEHPMLLAACLETLAEIGDQSSLDAIRRCFPDVSAIPGYLLSPYLKAISRLGDEFDFAKVATFLSSHNTQVHSIVLAALLQIDERCHAMGKPAPELSADSSALLSDITTNSSVSPNAALQRQQAEKLLGRRTIALELIN